MIIFPAIDLRGGRCVRLFQGDYARETVYGDNPAEQARTWVAAGAEFLHLVDLDGAKEGRIVNAEAVRSICGSVKIPCELGGGIRTVEEAEKAFELGVSRVILGTAACENPRITEAFTNRFGSDRIVVGIDARNGLVALRGWIETSEIPAFSLAKSLYLLGVNRIIFTDISTDGALKGPNFESVQTLCNLVPDCSIVASGGVTTAEDVRKFAELRLPNLEGVIVGKALYDGCVTVEELNRAAAAAAPAEQTEQKGDDHV